jgi:hypothetical protein
VKKYWTASVFINFAAAGSNLRGALEMSSAPGAVALCLLAALTFGVGLDALKQRDKV